MSQSEKREPVLVDRVQTGVRIVLHAFEGKAPFGPESLGRIEELKRVFGLTLDARDAHRLKENPRRRK